MAGVTDSSYSAMRETTDRCSLNTKQITEVKPIPSRR